MVASDLDQTLIYSARAVGDADVPLRVVEHGPGGEPMSSVTERAAELLSEVGRRALLVPVTTRTVEQYLRVRLPGRSRYAICANGGRLLVDGESDRDWEATVDARLAAAGIPLAEVTARLAATADPSWLLKRRTAEGLFAYLVVERAALPAGWLAELGGWCAERGWRVSLQGRKVYAVPTALTKSAGVAGLRGRLPGDHPVMAAGDSLLDADLLAAADAAWYPGHGELAADVDHVAYGVPHVTALADRGPVAAEAILGAMLARMG
ncbi:HAD family hydrolase [Kitasatospora sp. NPDC006697]|uniref:HAD family hydrolase n=1 Tax=Kitasatospora sp. NPDC006697 TaxID=3364020 RepID=UPI003692EE1B